VAGHLDADRFDVYAGLDVTTDGRLVWADGEVSTAEFDFLSPGGRATVSTHRTGRSSGPAVGRTAERSGSSPAARLVSDSDSVRCTQNYACTVVIRL
jgi:hypothetical protein